MRERLNSSANRIHKLLRQVGVNQFFAIRRGGSNHDSARIYYCRAAAKPQVIVFANAVRCDHVALVFDSVALVALVSDLVFPNQRFSA